MNKIVTLLGKRSFVCRSSQGGQSSFHVQTTLLDFQYCEATGALECMFWEILQKLAELHSTAYVFWQCKMIYCKLHILMKMVNCKVMMMENKCLTATTLISTHGAIWNYPGCWHQMYPHINKSTWHKCWPNVKLMLCSVTHGHQMPILLGVCLIECQPDPKAYQISSWHLTGGQPDPKLTKSQAELT